MRFALIDATNLVMRAASVLEIRPGPTGTSDGEEIVALADPAAAARSAYSMARKWITEIGATHVVACLDSPEGPSWRKARYADYKGDRKRDTRVYQTAVREYWTANGIVCTAVNGYEADDAIATLATRTAGRVDAHVLSADNDLLALTAIPGVTVWQFGRGGEPRHVARSAEWVCEKYGLTTPDQLTLYKTLVGEKGDNVPGVPQIGPVRAKKLIANWQTLDAMCQVGAIPPAHQAWAREAYELLTLSTNAPVPPIRPSECALPVRTAPARSAARSR